MLSIKHYERFEQLRREGSANLEYVMSMDQESLEYDGDLTMQGPFKVIKKG